MRRTSLGCNAATMRARTGIREECARSCERVGDAAARVQARCRLGEAGRAMAAHRVGQHAVPRGAPAPGSAAPLPASVREDAGAAPEGLPVTTRPRSHLASVLAALAVAACAPTATDAGAPRASRASHGEMRGYGVPAVDEPTLEAMLERCGTVERVPLQALAAIPQTDIRRRCEQLRRTRSTQPGNTVRVAPQPASTTRAAP